MRTRILASTLVLVLAGCQPSQPPAAQGTTSPPGSTVASASTAKAEPTAAPAPGTVAVNADNYARAETDMAFAGAVTLGGFGKIYHFRELTPLDKQVVVRQNRDTLYSSAVFDLDAGPVTITLPDPGQRFMSMQVWDEDQYTHDVVYKPGPYTLSKDAIGTRYASIALRTLVNPVDPKDIDTVHALQDKVQVSQPGGPGAFDVPKWDPVGLKKIRDALSVLGDTLPDKNHMFGTRAEVDPVRRLIGVATAWGGNPEKDATYLTVTPEQNDGSTVYRLTARDVPVDGFWSVTVYNAKGFFEPNPQNAYSFNNLTAQKDADGAITLQFGGCDGKVPNCLPIMPGWNYAVRLYRPRASILDGTWKFPEAMPVSG